jgi:hypothetical protein
MRGGLEPSRRRRASYREGGRVFAAPASGGAGSGKRDPGNAIRKGKGDAMPAQVVVYSNVG